MTSSSEDIAYDVLSAIKGLHNPQDTSDSVVTLWASAFRYAGITSTGDAVEAVVRHYSTEGANQWITPGDVIAGVKTIRAARIKGINDGDLTPDLDPFIPAREYVDTLQARAAAVMDGMPPAAAIATVRPSAAIEANR